MNPLGWYRKKAYVPGHREHRSNSPWRRAEDPKRILIIRFHAVGDVALTLPSCLALRKRYPSARIEFLTSPETARLARTVGLFDAVPLIEHPANRIMEIEDLLSVTSRLQRQHYQVVLDLQRNWKSRWIRRAVRPQSWSEFDRFSAEPACDRTMRAFHDAGFHTLLPLFELTASADASQVAHALLRSHGWQQSTQLVLLNPAGLWESRNWPLENFMRLAEQWTGADAVRFVLVGNERLRTASHFLAPRLGNRLIDLTGQTSLDVAFALLRFMDVVITEDSGLMHMAWALGKPLVALFGSSRHYWSVPTGEHVRSFHSGDLPCGACMQPRCKFGDTRCLARVTPEAVQAAAESVMRIARTGENRL